MITKFANLAFSNFKKYRNFNNNSTFSPTPTIASSSTITINGTNPSVVVTTSTPSYSFRTGVVLSDFTISAGTTGLTVSSLTRNSATQVTIAFTGTVASGSLTIQALPSAAEPPSIVSSNVLTIAQLSPTPTIATSSTITVSGTNPSVVVTTATSGYSFKSGVVLSDFTVGVGSTSLTAAGLTRNSATQVTISFTGTAQPGDVTIQAKTSASDPASAAVSNTLTISVITVVATGGAESRLVNGFRYHIFTSSGTLNATVGGNIQVMAVGGGGNGAGGNTGGGGGGGAIEPASGYQTIAINAGNSTVTVGAAGGGSSSFAGTTTLTALGGGNGDGQGGTGGRGGSGGGGGGTGGGAGLASGSNTNNGGSGFNGPHAYGAGGGGGATAVGGNGSGGGGGNGGNGKIVTDIDTLLTGTNFPTTLTGYPTNRFSEGGGGGAYLTNGTHAGGTGGGGFGRGSNLTGGTASTYGSGGGGGGANGGIAGGGPGKAGIVVIRYPSAS